MSDELAESIETSATSGMKSVTVDGQTVTSHDISQQIAADKYLRNKSAMSGNVLPIRMFNTRPPGAT